MAVKEEQEPNLFKYGLLILGFVTLVLVVEAAVAYLVLGGWGKSGPFGDTFGAANALFSGLAFGGVIVAILLQRKELELQRKELELTRNELARTAEAQEKSEQVLRKQLHYSFLTSKIEALSLAINHYRQEAEAIESNNLSFMLSGKKVQEARIIISQCQKELDAILAIFRQENMGPDQGL